MEFTKELIDKAKECKTAEEILALAKDNGIEMEEDEVVELLNKFNKSGFQEGELDDEELDNVAGGAEGCSGPNTYEKIYWNRKEDVQFIFNVGDQVEALAFGCKHHTATCKVVNRDIAAIYETQGTGGHSGAAYSQKFVGYVDEYWLEKCPGVSSAFVKGWYYRDRIEK